MSPIVQSESTSLLTDRSSNLERSMDPCKKILEKGRWLDELFFFQSLVFHKQNESILVSRFIVMDRKLEICADPE